MTDIKTNRYQGHEFTPLALESDNEDALTWEWCIRCGALKLGHEIFSPGQQQKPVIVPDEEKKDDRPEPGSGETSQG